jgi:hypothetical protein
MTQRTPGRPDWLRHALNQASTRSQTETLAIAALAVFVAIIIGALYLAQATATATTGFELEALVKTRDSFQRNNEDLGAQIAHKKDITDLRGRAQALGYQPVGLEQQQYIVVSGYSAVRASPTPEVTIVPTYIYDETFNGWLQQQLDRLHGQFNTWMGNAAPTATATP